MMIPVMLYKMIMATAVVGDGPNTSFPPPVVFEPFFSDDWSRSIIVDALDAVDPIKLDASWAELFALVMVNMTSNPKLPGAAWKTQ